MLTKFLGDVRTTASMYKHVKEARKAGAAAIDLQPVWKVSIVNTGIGFLDTVEGSVLSGLRSVYRPVREAFDRLPYETQHALSFAPKDGEYLERVRLFKSLLCGQVPEQVCHRAMGVIIRWYRVCRYDKIAATTEDYIAFRERMEGRHLGAREKELIYKWDAEYGKRGKT